MRRDQYTIQRLHRISLTRALTKRESVLLEMAINREESREQKEAA